MLGVYVPLFKFALQKDMQGFGEGQNRAKDIILKWMQDFYNDKERKKIAISKYDSNDENTFDIVLDKLTKQYENDQTALAIDIFTAFVAGKILVFL